MLREKDDVVLLKMRFYKRFVNDDFYYGYEGVNIDNWDSVWGGIGAGVVDAGA